MRSWLSSFLPPRITFAPAPGFASIASSTVGAGPPGFDAEKAARLATFEVKTRVAYALTMSGMGEAAYEKLKQRGPMTPELADYARGPGRERLRQLMQAMTILADTAGDISLPDGNGGLFTITEQLAHFRALFPGYAAR